IFRAGYDSPLPLLIALTILLLPFALLLRSLLHALRAGSAIHLATLLREASRGGLRRNGGRLQWELQTRKRFWMGFLLFCWAYFDLTASSLLAPSGMTPVFVRLYNLTHYGQSAVLSALMCAA